MSRKLLCVGMVLGLFFSLIIVGCSGGRGNGDGNGGADDGLYTVSGIVEDEATNKGLAGVIIRTESGQEVVTGEDGKWSLSDLTGIEVIMPIKTGWTFTPYERRVNKAGKNLDFRGADESSSGSSGTAGEQATHSLDDVKFYMRSVPGGLTFPTDIDDSSWATVEDPYWIAETPVTYELWYAVYVWATHDDRGNERYHFNDQGREGSGGTNGAAPTENKNHPVTMISGIDAKVWCNALTEYYNFKNGTTLQFVYAFNGEIARDSVESVTFVEGANGFRLLTAKEWELAARYIDGTNWTPGDYASGAVAATSDEEATKPVAWYSLNSASGTQAVGQKPEGGNSLGIYDMSGNVSEWCNDIRGIVQSRRGGHWYGDYREIRVGHSSTFAIRGSLNFLGFRVGRNH